MIALGQVASQPRTERASRIAWLSFLSACLAWMFDAMDLTIFTLVLFPSVSELIGSADPGPVASTGGLILACKLLAWALVASHLASSPTASDAPEQW